MRKLVIVALVGNLVLCSLAFFAYNDIGKLQERIELIEEAMNNEFTGLVFRFDGGAVELHQTQRQSLTEFRQAYELAVREYLGSKVQ